MAVSEYRQKDANGRIPLSSREYSAIRAIYGAVNSLAEYHQELERRCKGYKNGWRDLRCLVWLSEKVMRDILMTVPLKKLMQMNKDLDNTICITKVRGVVGEKVDGFMYIKEDDLLNICQCAIDMNCFGCDKTQKEAKKNCKLYKAIQSTVCFELDECESCPFADGGFFA